MSATRHLPPAPQHDHAQLVVQYVDFMQDQLTWPSKSAISALTMLADENRQAAPAIAAAIQLHLKQCAVGAKLPALYLLDSIVKNLRQPYIDLFAANLEEVFMHLWQFPALQEKAQRVFSMWGNVFPAQVLQSIDAQIRGYPAGQAPAQQALPGPPVVLPPPQLQQPAPVYSMPQQQLPVPAPSTAQQQQQLQQQAAPMAASVSSLLAALLPQQAGEPPQPQAQWQQQWQQPAAQQHQELLPSQHQQQGGMHAAQVPQMLSGLANLLQATQQQSQPEAADRYAAVPSQQQQAPASAPGATEFTAGKLKDSNPAAVSRLMEDTAAHRAKYQELHFSSKRRLQEQDRPAPRQWFVPADLWLLGSTAVADAQAEQTAQFFALVAALSLRMQEDLPVQQPKKVWTVPLDEGQTHCAISGERLETMLDGHDAWVYKDAKRLTAAEAAQYGLAEGAIVLVNALAGTPSESGDTVGAGGPAQLQDAQSSRQAPGGKRAAGEDLVPAGKRVKVEGA